MINHIFSFDFLRTLPLPLQGDERIAALAQVVSNKMHEILEKTDENIIYAHIDKLREDILDILAYDLNVMWYDYEYPIDVKRAILKDAFHVHRYMGTKYATETALGAVFPGAQIKEWFEYEGEPYRFKVLINATNQGVSGDRQAAVLDRIQFYKNLRSHLDSIKYTVKKDTKVTVDAFASVGQKLSIYPKLVKELSADGTIGWAGYLQIANRLEILPKATEEDASPMSDPISLKG